MEDLLPTFWEKLFFIMIFPHQAFCQVTEIQNNHYATVVYLGVTCSEPQQYHLLSCHPPRYSSQKPQMSLMILFSPLTSRALAKWLYHQTNHDCILSLHFHYYSGSKLTSLTWTASIKHTLSPINGLPLLTPCDLFSTRERVIF